MNTEKESTVKEELEDSMAIFIYQIARTLNLVCVCLHTRVNSCVCLITLASEMAHNILNRTSDTRRVSLQHQSHNQVREYVTMYVTHTAIRGNDMNLLKNIYKDDVRSYLQSYSVCLQVFSLSCRPDQRAPFLLWCCYGSRHVGTPVPTVDYKGTQRSLGC